MSCVRGTSGLLLATQPVLSSVRLGGQMVLLCRPALSAAAVAARGADAWQESSRQASSATPGSASTGGGSSGSSEAGPSRPVTPMGSTPPGLAPPPGLEEFEGAALPRPSEAKDADEKSDCSTADTAVVPGALTEVSAASTPLPPATPSADASTSVLRLDDALVSPLSTVPVQMPGSPLGSPGCPTVGSAYHYVGLCKPCAHAFRTGCRNGAACPFCHLCGADEIKRRKKERQGKRRNVQRHSTRGAAMTPWDLMTLF